MRQRKEQLDPQVGQLSQETEERLHPGCWCGGASVEPAGVDNKRSSPAGSTIKGTKHTFGGTRQTKQGQERNVKKKTK